MWMFAVAVAAPCAVVSPCEKVEVLPTKGGNVVHYREKGSADAAPMDRLEKCASDWWVYQPKGGAERLVLSVCNDGYGASMVGEDVVEVDANGRFTHHQNGGSAWRWSHSTTLQLDPPRVLSEGSDSFFMGMLGSSVSWDWTTFSGKLSSQFQECGGGEEDYTEPEALLIPKFEAKGYDPAKMSLGACAVQVGGNAGYRPHGKAAGESDAGFKAAMVGDALIIELTDDTWVRQAESWIKADHVEIWAMTEHIDVQSCVKRAPALQWGVMLDGTVHAAHGNPKPVKAEVFGEGPVRLKITGLPEPLTALTVVYSDSDDGARQERLIATSPVKFAHGESLGQLYDIKPAHAVCVPVDGALTVQQTREFKAGAPLLSGNP